MFRQHGGLVGKKGFINGNDLRKVNNRSFFKPRLRLSSRRFAGADAKSRFDVITAQMTVLIALRLNVSPWIISTGRRFAGSEPRGVGRQAHQISPRIMDNLSR
jgi:hypothetical protein